MYNLESYSLHTTIWCWVVEYNTVVIGISQEWGQIIDHIWCELIVERKLRTLSLTILNYRDHWVAGCLSSSVFRNKERQREKYLKKKSSDLFINPPDFSWECQCVWELLMRRLEASFNYHVGPVFVGWSLAASNWSDFLLKWDCDVDVSKLCYLTCTTANTRTSNMLTPGSSPVPPAHLNLPEPR